MDWTRRWTLIVSILASGVVFLDGSVVNIALPAIDRNLNAGLAGLQWIVDGYLLTLASLLILGGSLGDRFGRKRTMLIGLSGFGIASILCGLAWSTPVLIAFRMLQGLFGALLVPVSLALLRDHFAEGEELGSAIGHWSGWSGITTVIGPLVGGFLVDTLSWRWVFFIAVPVITAAAYLLARKVPESEMKREAAELDWIGTILIVLGLGGLVFGLIQGPVSGWTSIPVIGSISAGLLLLIIFPIFESRTAHPMVPLEIFRRRNFSVANVTTLFVYFGLYGLTFFLVIFLQNVQDYSAFLAGLATAPISLILLLFSPLFGRLAGRYGPRWFMAGGPILCALGLLAFLRLGPEPDFLGNLLPAVLIFSFGLGITVSPLTNTVISSAPEENSGLASAINNAVSRIAALVAIALLGVVVSQTYAASIQNQTEQAGVSPSEAAVILENQDDPTGALQEDLSEPARSAVNEAYTTSFHRAMIVCSISAGTGGVVSGLFLRNRMNDKEYND